MGTILKVSVIIIRVIIILHLILLMANHANSLASFMITSIASLLLINFKYDCVGFLQLTLLNIVSHADCLPVLGLIVRGNLMAFFVSQGSWIFSMVRAPIEHNKRQHSTQ